MLSRKSDRLAERDQAVRVGVVHRMVQESIRLAEQQISQLEVLNNKTDSQAQTSAVILSTLRSGIVSLNQVQTLVQELNNVVAQHSVPGGIDTHWKQAPVTMELAIGKPVPIPLELVNTWDMLDTVLCELFRHHPTYRWIQRKLFIVYYESTRRVVDRRWALETALRPGDKVNMGILFNFSLPNWGCVRCKLPYPTSSRNRQCHSCGQWFSKFPRVQLFVSGITVNFCLRFDTTHGESGADIALSPKDTKQTLYDLLWSRRFYKVMTYREFQNWSPSKARERIEIDSILCVVMDITR